MSLVQGEFGSFDALARAIDNKVRVVILSRRADRMEEFLASNHPPVPILILNSAALIHDLDLTATPQTFVVNPQGRVEHHWYGAYTGQTRDEIEKTFHLHLPQA